MSVAEYDVAEAAAVDYIGDIQGRASSPEDTFAVCHIHCMAPAAGKRHCRTATAAAEDDRFDIADGYTADIDRSSVGSSSP